MMAAPSTTGAEQSLKALAEEIRDCWQQRDELRIVIGRKLLDARNRVQVGEAGKNVTWEKWVERNIKRSMRDVQKCIALVEGTTDGMARAALAAYRAKAAAAMKQHRDQRKA